MPILNLSNTAKEIAHNKDYSIRAKKTSSDEIGTLVDSFNMMLVEIEKNDTHLRDREYRLRKLAENLPIGIYRTTPDGRIDMANPTLIRMLGYSSFDELATINLEKNNQANSSSRDLFKEQIEEKGEIIGFEAEWVGKDNSLVYIRENAKTICDKDDTILYYEGTVEDISERKNEENNQEKLLKEIENINQELKDFAYVVSHDLKVPLRAIGSLTEWISTDYMDKFDDEGKKLLNLLTSRVKRMHDLIEGILHYSRIGRIKEDYIQIDLNTFLPELIDFISPPDSIQVLLKSDFPTIMAERTRITQIFQNLISNAVKYMDKPEGKIEISCRTHDDMWEFLVKDNGPGIEEKYFKKIFLIFQTLVPRDQFESTGVGLSIVKKIVENYGGHIWVDSIFGQGCTFHFTLPQSTKTANCDIIGVKDAKQEANFVSGR